jgi:signal peptidase I
MSKKKIYLKMFIVVISSITLILPYFLSPAFQSNYSLIIKPSIWIILALTTIFVLPKYQHKFSLNRYDVRQLALIGALVYVIIYFSSGIIIGYTKSPFDRSLLGIIRNMWMIGSVIVAQEFVREAFFKTTTKHDKWFTIIFVTSFFILLDLNLHTVGNIFDSVSSFMGFMTKNFITAVVINSFVSYLTFRDGIKASLLFLLPYNFVFLITPVFPANVFVVLLIIETIVPLLIYLNIEKTYQRNNVFGLTHKLSTGYKLFRLSIILILIGLMTFTLGLLPFVPIVIASNSMYPTIERGDIVVMRKTPFEEIKINDIIEYKLDRISVIHRVLEIRNTREGKVLITKGDNNASNDSEPVSAEQVHGVIVSNIPKAGYPTLWLREVISGTKVDTSIEMGEE